MISGFLATLRRPFSKFVFAGLALGFVTAPAAVATRPAEPADSFVVTGVRVFDGTSTIAGATVVVRNGRIHAVGTDVGVPADLPLVDGTGMTLLPGFIDGHAHAHARFFLERAIQFGVTTELDMWTDPRFAARMRREQRRTGAFDRADLLSAGHVATLPEGYPHNFTPEIETPTLETPDEAAAFVAARVREGSDYLKLMIEDGTIAALDLQVLPRPVVRALTRATRNQGILAVAHVTEKVHARTAIEDGVDGLAHVFVDELADPALLELAARRGIFVAATLNVEESFVTTAGGATLVVDPELAPYLYPEEVQALLTPAPPNLMTIENVEIAKENILRLRRAGVPILAGTDMITHGVSLHRELELLVEAGLSPAEALEAATSAPALAFGLADRGRIAPGLRADLLLVEGDPTTEVEATRALRRIWKAGVEVPRSLPGAAPVTP